VIGSLVGVGGGFLIVPLLRLAFDVPPAQVAGTSLILVFANTAASTVGYVRDGKVDLSLAGWMTAGAIPAGVLGVVAVHKVNGAGFDIAYACVLAAIAVLVVRRRSVASRPVGERTFMHDWRVGLLAGVAIGFFSSLFGIGGGIVTIPLLLIAARMPAHIVTATSAFVIATTAPVGVIGHAVSGDIDWQLTVPLVAGGLIGGTLAPPIARRVSSPRLLAILAAALIVAAAGLIIRHLV
jgi:uncharacterized membrane protein YfcA